MIQVDGSNGEGGGQILRTALSLSMVTGKPFTIERIRAGRPKPGLLRQHLVAVEAAATVCGAQTQGASLRSTTLTFTPGSVKAGEYQFDIGSAGSTTLVAQTLLPALVAACNDSGETASVRIKGGTHNAFAPPAHFLQRSFLPLVQRMGWNATLELKRHGFYPAGGGEVVLTVAPNATAKGLQLTERGGRVSVQAEAIIAGVPAHVAKRELALVGELLGWPVEALQIRGLSAYEGPGNALLLTVAHENVTEVFTGFGDKGIPAETVAKQTVESAKGWLVSKAAAGEYLADQLLLPAAMAALQGHPSNFTALTRSPHFDTNVQTIQRFVDVKVEMAEEAGGARGFRVGSQ